MGMTETRVVHVQREAFDVYIGRGKDPRTNEFPAKRWGNPWKVGPDGTREEVIDKFRRWLWREIRAGRVTEAELAGLHGATLGCWCKPHACHGDVLVEAAKWARERQLARFTDARTAMGAGRA